MNSQVTGTAVLIVVVVVTSSLLADDSVGSEDDFDWPSSSSVSSSTSWSFLVTGDVVVTLTSIIEFGELLEATLFPVDVFGRFRSRLSIFVSVSETKDEAVVSVDDDRNEYV